MTRKSGPPLGVENSFLLWKEGGGGGSRVGRKKLFDPISFFRIPIPPCVLIEFGNRQCPCGDH
jgi:hypothetical protein